MNRSFAWMVVVLLVLLGGVVFGTQGASADTIALQTLPNGSLQVENYYEGYEFNLNKTVYLTALGAYDANSSGTVSTSVYLYQVSTQNLMASATVSGTCTAGACVWTTVPTVALSAGYYRIIMDASAATGEPTKYNVSGETWSPEVSWSAGTWASPAGSHAYPTTTQTLSADKYLGANFKYVLTIGMTANGVTGYWRNGSSWSGGTAPGASDDATIDNAVSHITVDADASAKTLTVAAGFLTVNGGTLTVSGTATVSGGTVDLYSKLATTTGTLQLSSGTVTLHGSGTTDLISDSMAVTVSSGAFDLSGVSETVGAVTISGGTVQNGTLTGTSYGISGGTISGVNLAGTGSALTKSGSGTVTLSGANTYTGATTISAGALSVNTIASGGNASAIGASGDDAANLVLNGGALQYTGGNVTTTRLFSVGTSGGTIDASGTGALSLSNTGTMGLNSQTGARTLTLTGTSTAANTLAAAIGDNGGPTSLTKSGTGAWVLSGTNTYSGSTTVSGGTLHAVDGASLPAASALCLAGGVLESNNGTLGNFTRTIGQNMQWAAGSNGGFAARGGDLTVDVGFAGTSQAISKSGMSYNYVGTPVFGGTSTSDAGRTKLLNGVIGSTSWDDGNWAEIRYDTPLSITFSLGGEKTLASVSSWYLRWYNADPAPGQIDVYVKNGVGDTWHLAGSGTGFDDTNDVVNEGVVNLLGTPNATDVQITYTHSGTFSTNWLLLSEVTFYAPGTAGPHASLTWGSTTGFIGANQTLMFGSATADSKVEFKNAINLNNAVRTIQADDNPNVNTDYAEISGALTSTTPASGGITKTGAGLLKFTGANTYAGSTTISAGVLEASISGTTISLPADSHLILNGGVFQSHGTLTRALSTGGAGCMHWTAGGGFAARDGELDIVLNDHNWLTWNSSGFVPTGSALILGSTTANSLVDFQNQIDFNGAVRTIQVDDNPNSAADYARLSYRLTNGGLDKTGAGLLEISSTLNDYAGGTTISAGTLKVTGTIGDVIVKAGAKLTGNGQVGSVAVGEDGGDPGATVAPGNSPGTLHVTGDCTMNDGSVYEWELLAAGTAGIDYDTIAVTGNLTLDSTWTLEVLKDAGFGAGTYISPLTQFDLFTYTGFLSTALSGDELTSVSIVLGSGLEAAGWDIDNAKVKYAGSLTEGGRVYLTGLQVGSGGGAVPEPAALGLIGLVLLALRRRRSR